MRALKFIGTLFCLLLVLTAVFFQFKMSSIFPLVLACLFTIPIRWLRSSWLRAAWILPIGGFALLVVDAYALRHRIAVEARVEWNVFGGGVLKKFVSPSGRTTAYLANVGFVDSCYIVYVSEGGLFPLFGYVHLGSQFVSYPDLTVGWRDTLFVIGQGPISYAYSELDHKPYSYDEWTRGPVGIHDTPKTLESFSAFIETLKPKG